MATGFDLVGLLLIIIMSVSGLKKGLVDGVLKIVGMYAAMYGAMHYNHHGSVFLDTLVSIPDAYKTPAGFVVVFLGVMYSITFVSYLLKKIVKSLHLGAVDRIGGITFGALKAGLMLSAFVWAFAMVPVSMRGDWQKDSKLYPHVETFAGQMVYVLSLEDELALLQTMVDPDADKTELLQAAMGGEMGGLQGLLGDGDGGDQNEILGKALESMGGSQKGLLEQMLKSAGVDDVSNLDIMEEVEKVKHAGTNRQAEMDKKLEEIEAMAQGRPVIATEEDSSEVIEEEAEGLEE
ncbi:MAG: CvpA family protein [Candidatus Marinimicrobia bacterium]|jgi:membrane protein required for colicin V production|nr:CvpA family protein [Candidatus Neomarinimicrobiota bacterium]MBT3575598.1 CvpA family protein [Candidatus Neomarinimicrobiota bacterium]MBT3681251.1 CvpA family protein [Candidatus Neomarinimicrobiota bacterium]MBT3950652.1 CvpA family protein [Candidatus Neomarinimicrobiota bacterium]MBT4253361.1 CvpA family protein [Candidatus Neomarinimicrobiota bacterium]